MTPLVGREGFDRLFHSRPVVADAMCRVIAERQSGVRERRERAQPAQVAENRSRLLSKMRAIFRF